MSARATDVGVLIDESRFNPWLNPILNIAAH